MCSTWEWWHAVVTSALRKQRCRVSAAHRLLTSRSDGVWDGHPTLTFSLSAYMCVMHTGRCVHVLPSERPLSFMCHKIDKQLTVKQILIQEVQNGVWETRFLTCFQILYVLLCTHALWEASSAYEETSFMPSSQAALWPRWPTTKSFQHYFYTLPFCLPLR